MPFYDIKSQAKKEGVRKAPSFQLCRWCPLYPPYFVGAQTNLYGTAPIHISRQTCRVCRTIAKGVVKSEQRSRVSWKNTATYRSSWIPQKVLLVKKARRQVLMLRSCYSNSVCKHSCCGCAKISKHGAPRVYVTVSCPLCPRRDGSPLT